MRLIDADATLKKIKNGYCADCDNYRGIKCRACLVRDCMNDIEDQPTYINKESEDEN